MDHKDKLGLGLQEEMGTEQSRWVRTSGLVLERLAVKVDEVISQKRPAAK